MGKAEAGAGSVTAALSVRAMKPPRLPLTALIWSVVIVLAVRAISLKGNVLHRALRHCWPDQRRQPIRHENRCPNTA